ncbi:MAG TPA: GAP family protein [Ilumatobacteraceae bacterium]|nr:GAP family protein [Ilumatobacteraceae bacterium]
MLDALGQILPMAIVVALSPMPIIAVVLMLVSAKARVNGPMFVIGWLVGMAVVGGIVLVAAGPEASDSGDPATWVAYVELAIGVLLLLLAVKQWRARPAEGMEVEMPKWMAAVDSFTPLKSAGFAAFFGGVNPKNLLLILAAASTIAQTGISGGEQAIVYGVFCLIGTLGVAIPVIVYFALGDRAPALLRRMQMWMAHNNAAIMSVLLLVIGVKIFGDGLSAL